jgi:ABC-type transport system involved in multi-copper enzyme maturation permease subunit
MMENNISANARIIDRGYQHYDGTRLGLGHSEWVMLKAALLRGLGLRRNFRNKIMPWLLIVIAFLPSVVILGIQITVSLALTSPYAGLYASSIDVVFILFAGLVAADLICADRRERVISLYFSAPITRLHYIAAQVIGLVLLLLLLTVAPYVILFFGQALLAPAFATFVGNHLSDLRSVLLGGTLIAFFYGSLAMAVSAFTDRRAYATGGFLGLVLVSKIAGGILASPLLHFSGHEWFSLLDLVTMPINATLWMLGATAGLPLDGSAYLWGSFAVIVMSLALVGWRYLKVSD